MTTGTKANPDPRAEYIAGLRALADLLEQRPDLEMPLVEEVVIPLFGKNQRERVALWTRLLPGRKTKQEGGTLGDVLRIKGTLRGLPFRIICDREEVCEKRVLRTETVTETVPDPDYVAAAPLVERTTEREIVEWHCHSILAGAQS